MSEMACNPYAADWTATCGAMTLPTPTVNPYQPDLFLFQPFAPVVWFEWPEPSAPPPLPLAWEDELTALAVQPAPFWVAQAAQSDAAPVPEPAGAVLLALALLAGLWRIAR